MKKFFAVLTGFFTRNWGLKLLSLILAILVYYALKPDYDYFQDRNERRIFKGN
ncbi:MAG: hypothetical protein J6W80_02465 [Kiritimatiellae bacterium]|nr:hypothetical protein [Kiritimatiellia bacterium]